MAGNTANTMNSAEAMLPTMGAAMHFMTSAPLLVLILSDDALNTARAEQLCDRCQQMDQKQPEVLHMLGRLTELLATTRSR